MTPARRPPSPRLLASLLLALTLAGCFDPPPSAALVHPEPLAVASAEGPAPTGEHPTDRMARGMRAYGAGDYAAAVAELEAARSGLTGYKEIIAQLYLGSALRMHGRHERALTPLGLVSDEARRVASSDLLDAAQFERAQALLALGRVTEARTALRDVVAARNVHGPTAVQQLERLEQLDALQP